MSFTPEFLNDLRSRVRVSEVVGRRVKLKKFGAEFKGLSPFSKEDTPSFCVNDAKQRWFDFSGGKNGDVFDFIIESEGVEFPEAVKRVAELAGVRVDEAGGSSHRSHGRTRMEAADEGGAHRAGDGVGDAGAQLRDSGQSSGASKREITQTFDYTDADGTLIYQTCRLEWTEKGKRRKSFLQRRPLDGEPGRFAWGLSAGTYVRSNKGDFVKLTDEREMWDGERREFEAVVHGLYRFPDLREEMAQDEDDRRTIFLPEGERKADVHVAWGLVATCSSGGARHWLPHHAEELRGADVVIEADNDKAGREGADKKARSLKGIAKRVRVLHWGDAWPKCPEKGDVVDFKKAGGTVEQLYEMVDKLKDWIEPPYDSKFGLVMWAEQDVPGEEYDYLVEDLIPEREAVLVFGQTQSGKSFFVADLAMAGAQAKPFFGRRILEPFGVVYCAYEAGKGFKSRMRAYRRAHNIGLDDIPFALLTHPKDLWADDGNVDLLIDEILGVARSHFFGVRLGAVVIDTHNAAMTGASEIDSETAGKIRERYRRIIERTEAGVWIVSHKNSQGRHRGNEQLYNNIDTAIDISVKTHIDNKKEKEDRDTRGRVVRVAQLVKQREGETGHLCEFALQVVESGGQTKFGKPRTSCVVERAAMGQDDGQSDIDTLRGQSARAEDPSAVRLNDDDVTFFKALLAAVEKHGVAPPSELALPHSIKAVCTTVDLGKEYRDMVPNDEAQTEEGQKKYQDKIKGKLRNARTKFHNRRAIGILRAPGTDESRPYYIWPSGRRVIGPGFTWPAQTRQFVRKADTGAPIDTVTGEPIDSLGDDKPF